MARTNRTHIHLSLHTTNYHCFIEVSLILFLEQHCFLCVDILQSYPPQLQCGPPSLLITNSTTGLICSRAWGEHPQGKFQKLSCVNGHARVVLPRFCLFSCIVFPTLILIPISWQYCEQISLQLLVESMTKIQLHGNRELSTKGNYSLFLIVKEIEYVANYQPLERLCIY